MKHPMLGPALLGGFTIFGIRLNRTNRANVVTTPLRQIDALSAARRINGHIVIRRDVDRIIGAKANTYPARYA